MSGHSGFQAIGGSPVLPPVLPPSVDGPGGPAPLAGISGAPAPSSPPASDADPAPAAGTRTPARTLSQKLDTLLLAAARNSTRAVDSAALAQALNGTFLDEATRTKLEEAAQYAYDTFDALGELSGGEIASALSTDAKGVFDWDSGDDSARAIKDAVDAQSALSACIRKLVNSQSFPRDVCDALCEMAHQADRRQSEILSLAVQLAGAAGHAGTDPQINARLHMKFADLLPRQSLSMHGNEIAIARMQAKLQPLADSIETFASKPDAAITSEEFQGYGFAVNEAANALGRVARDGFLEDGKGVSWKPDKALLSAATKLVSGVRTVLSDIRMKVGLRSVRAFVENTLRMSDDLTPVFSGENLAELEHHAPTLARAVRLRNDIYSVATQYTERPTFDAYKQMMKAAEALRNNSREIELDIKRLSESQSPWVKKTITAETLNKIKVEFASPRGMKSQVAHLQAMIMNVFRDLSPEKFLSTTSAQALLEGRFKFTTLVEARVHGMADEDINPALDDSRMRSSTKLGSGAVNTVQLVTYDDGSEFVFKPEAPGRQGMEHIVTSKDYKPELQLAQLNIATQKTADALGLGDIMPQSITGCHKGQFGIFMEKAPGVTGNAFAFQNKTSGPGHLSAREIKNLSGEEYCKVIGGLIRQTNRLEWFDLITGQGDRHHQNYMVDVMPDVKNNLSVTVKGIDNDECFPAYREGLLRFRLGKRDKEIFQIWLEKIPPKYPPEHQEEVRARLLHDKGVTELEDGGILVDATKFESKELLWVMCKTVGIPTGVLPEYMDRDLFKHLMSLESGKARDDFRAELSRRLPKDAVKSAMARLDEAIKYAKDLDEKEMVIDPEDFEDYETQNRIMSNFVHAPANPLDFGDYKLKFEDEVTRNVILMESPIFMRDLYPGIGIRGWFA